ncbi:hypothetical protein QJS04_geneDACA021184 [Acorus gramineus]|uniref:Uncharacterized protein n=1 Tax=Acorus gramineus TaxID=55184 RepID=A0AAV9AG62_ACOGR|nr:hypothetical protein QJS04_geneDACA021184 [Acorus gramineus]
MTVVNDGRQRFWRVYQLRSAFLLVTVLKCDRPKTRRAKRAQLRMARYHYYGSKAHINAYAIPDVKADQGTSSSIFLLNGFTGSQIDLNAIQAGWEVPAGAASGPPKKVGDQNQRDRGSQHLLKLWRPPKGEIVLTLQGNEFFIVRLNLEEDLLHALQDGPCSMGYRPFIIQLWNRDSGGMEFKTLQSIPVWKPHEPLKLKTVMASHSQGQSSGTKAGSSLPTEQMTDGKDEYFTQVGAKKAAKKRVSQQATPKLVGDQSSFVVLQEIGQDEDETGSNSKAKNAPANPPKQLKKEKTQLQPQPLIEDGSKALSETSRVVKLVLESSVPPNKLDPPTTPRWPLEVLRTRVLLLEHKHTLIDARDGKEPSDGIKMIENGERHSWDHMTEIRGIDDGLGDILDAVKQGFSLRIKMILDLIFITLHSTIVTRGRSKEAVMYTDQLDYKHIQVDARDGKGPSGWFKMIENGRLLENRSSTKMPCELESLKQDELVE